LSEIAARSIQGGEEIEFDSCLQGRCLLIAEEFVQKVFR
jgi:hypothetical protein